MKTFLSIIGFVLAVLLVVAGCGLIVAWLYYWFAGMFALGAAWLGAPWWASLIVLILISSIVRPSVLVFAIAGFFGTMSVLGWPWYFSLAVYAPTIALMFVAAISTAAIAVFALITSTFSRR